MYCVSMYGCESLIPERETERKRERETEQRERKKERDRDMLRRSDLSPNNQRKSLEKNTNK